MKLRIFILAILLPLGSCTTTQEAPPPPLLSFIADAPENIREAVTLTIQDDGSPTLDYHLDLHRPKDEWVDLKPTYEGNELFVSGSFAHGDDDPFTRVRIRVDTGANGYLSFPLGHELANGIWLSAELGEQQASTFTNPKRSWTGVGSGLGIEGIILFPIPLSVNQVSDPVLAQSPLLGQAWFDLTKGIWIDPSDKSLSVSFETDAVSRLIKAYPDSWIELPWRTAKENGHRFVPISIGGQSFEAVIDTGNTLSLLLDTHPPPSFVRKPWARELVSTGGGMGKIIIAMNTTPLYIGSLGVDDLQISWTPRPFPFTYLTPTQHPLAILGVPFLRRYPVLLDPASDLAYFFIGDQTDLSSINRTIRD